MNKVRREKRTTRLRGEKARQLLTRFAVYAAFAAAVIVLLAAAMTPRRYALNVGDIAEETIYATKDVEDQVTYNEQVAAAEQTVGERYKLNDQLTENALDGIDEYFVLFGQLRERGQKELERIEEENDAAVEAAQSVDPETGTVTPGTPVLQEVAYSSDFIARLRESETLLTLFSNDQIKAVLDAEDEQLNRLSAVLEVNVGQVMKTGVQKSTISDQRENLRTTLESGGHGLSAEMVSVGYRIIYGVLQVNMEYDADATALAREQAISSIEVPVWQKGAVIVSEGNMVTEAQIAALRSLGLLDDGEVDLWLYVGIALMVAVLIVLLSQYLKSFEAKATARVRKLIMPLAVIAFTLLVSLLVSEIDTRIAPTMTCALLLTLLIGPRMALIINFFMALLNAMMLSGSVGLTNVSSLSQLFSSMLGGMAGVFLLQRNIRERSGLIVAGMGGGLVSAIVIMALGLITTSNLREVVISGVWALGSALLSAVLCIGTLSVWEVLFDVVTPTRLLEQANPNHPLLRRLLLEAAGTYHHSIIVANLAERAADVLGADMLLTRTGAFFHDIGKLSAPYYFKENQMGGGNPHDLLAPEVSASVLTAHTQDGLALAQQYKLPKAVCDIICQHHGTTLTGYFYAQAKNNASDPSEIREEDFRYSGPKPQTREAGLIMLADTVEAAVRSLNNPTSEQVETMIRDLIRAKLNDGQLDECDLTLRDLNIVAGVFVRSLRSVYHERVAYPKVEEREEETPDEEIPQEAEELAAEDEVQEEAPVSNLFVDTIASDTEKEEE